ncbi:MAG TPA: gliding motility lipoprotein GldD [Flavobacterium sp.]|nr:gliding motility lipoprotein GldD [Flavobacterium sp.]
MRRHYFILLGLALTLASCKEEVLPKPPAQLRLEYGSASYDRFDKDCPFSFEMNRAAVLKKKDGCNLTIDYPKMKATIYISYKPVSGNIKLLLRDAQKLTYEHVIKADNIIEQPFLNRDHKVYGMFYEVNGNAATNSQFYVTDSVHHFIDGSVYFYAKPNFDSVMPAVEYVKKDMRRIMESVKWK